MGIWDLLGISEAEYNQLSCKDPPKASRLLRNQVGKLVLLEGRLSYPAGGAIVFMVDRISAVQPREDEE